MKHKLQAEYLSKIFYNIPVARSCLFLVSIFIFSRAFSQDPVSFTFNLPQASKTSAGVYKRDSTLIRTLWNNVFYTAGTHTGLWDRKNDEGRLSNDTGLVVRIISNNVQYTWEGVIGNTSDSFTGSTVIRMFDRMSSLAIAGNIAYYGAGYVEGITSSYKFNTNDPQKKYNILNTEHGDMSQAAEFVATDSNYVYWAGYDPFDTARQSFIIATRVSDDSEVMFPAGSPVEVTFGRQYPKAIDVTKGNKKAMQKGLAVQKKGIYLFVSHPGINELRVLNKTSGALVQTIAVASPRDLAMDGDDNLWMISGTTTVSKYSVNSSGTLSAALLTVSGLADPMSIAVSPDNKTLVVVDAGSSQQLKAFDNTSGSLLWTFGQKGGYETDPLVSDDKFYFSDEVTGLTKPFLAFQPDGSFWVADVGNERVQHYASSRVFIDRIMCLPHSYSVVADRNDPERVFNEYLEFSIDYSKSLAPDNGSWILVRNWRHGITKDYFNNAQSITNVFNNLITLSNGRTYATLENRNNPNVRYPELVELPASGNLRYTGIRFGDFAKDIIETDGSLRRFISTGQPGTGGYWETQPLTGFSNNNPVWGSSSRIASIPSIRAKDPANGDMSSPVMTSSRILVLFDNGKVNTGYHLGAVKMGDSNYLWKTSHATSINYSGPFPTDGAYDIGNNVEYAGGNVYAEDQNIFWNYHGEFWKNSQTNKWNHFYDNGLMVGQFGITNPEGEAMEKEAFAMGAGNVFSSSLVKVGPDYYLYHNDESVHGGVHRWKISRLNSIQEQVIPLNYAANASGGLDGFYFDGQNLDNTNLRISMLHPTVNIKNAPQQISNPADFSARFKGFVQPLHAENYTFHTITGKGVRLWIDGLLLIDQWGNANLKEHSSNPIFLDSGKLYSIKMEMKGGVGSLWWSGASQPKQLIPRGNLYPSGISVDEEGTDLLEGLQSYNVLEDGLYGWNRNPTAEDSSSDNQYWRLKTNVKAYDREKPDLFMTFKRDNGQYEARRNIGIASPCLSSWKIKGHFNFEGNNATSDLNGGSYIDVLDDQDKVISRITHEQVYSVQGFHVQIKCNGEAIFSEPQGKVFIILARAQPFEISGSQSGVIFRYADYIALSAPVFDTTAHWNRPRTVRFGFSGGSSNQQRAVDIGSLRFTAASTPKLFLSGSGTVCEGQSVTITAGKSNLYLWNNGSRKQSITVTTSGNYSVTTTDASGCSSASQSVFIDVRPLPQPVIQVNGNSLVSSIDQGNQWYLDGKLIPGANSKVCKALEDGTYTLVVTDSNECSGSASYEFKSGLEDKFYSKITIIPNPSKGIIKLHADPGLSGKISIYDVTGQLIWKTENLYQEINMSSCAAGIYTLLLITGCKTYNFKFIIQ